MQFEKDHPEFFSWPVIYDLLFNWEFTKFYFLYSWETFWDFFAIMLTLVCGIYTFGLMIQTVNFARQESSMIDDMKLKMYMKNRKLWRKELIEFFRLSKQRRTLNMTELLDLVFGEATLFSLHTWIPVYRIPRSINQASEIYLNKVV